MLLYMERFGRMKIDDINEVSVTPFIQLTVLATFKSPRQFITHVCSFFMPKKMQNDVLMYRKKLVKDIYENPNNNPKDVSDEVIAQDEYHILDDTICLSPPPSDLRNSPPNRQRSP